VITPKIAFLAVAAIVGFVAGYSVRAQIVGQSQHIGQSEHVPPLEIRRAIPVEPEIRKAIPVQTGKPKTAWPSAQNQPAPVASSFGAAIRPTTRVPSVGAPFVGPATSQAVGNASRTSPRYTYSAPSARSYTRSPSTPGYYSRYYDYNYRPPVGEHYVHSYIRSDGTFVSGHYRTNRDDSFWNNYSSYANINPHTGRTGYKLPRVGGTGYKLPRLGRSTYALRLH
jgi:hypothetical protein